jgi:predicted dienelactone hydrolase
MLVAGTSDVPRFLIPLICASLPGVLPTASQAASADVAFRTVRVPAGPPLAVWYPRPRGHMRYPLIVFSHGFNGCGTQSVFLTESLARAGYVVAAPDHHDAACSVEGPRIPRLHLPHWAFASPGHWTADSYADRRRDLERVLDWIHESEFAPFIDSAHIGVAGHSLGGYSVLALAGAWDSWRESAHSSRAGAGPVRPAVSGA